MTDSQTLLLIVLAIYFSECLHWTNLHAVVIVIGRWGKWSWSQPGGWFGNDQRGVVIKPLLAPVPITLLTQLWPISISPTGVLSNTTLAVKQFRRPEQPSQFVAYDEITSIDTEDSWLRINGQRFTHCVTSLAARSLASIIQEVRERPSAARAEFIDAFLAASLDDTAVEKRLRKLQHHRVFVSALATLLFAHTFFFSPYLVSTRGWQATWPIVFGGVLVLTWFVTVFFWFAHRALYPDETGARWTQVAVMLLNPPAAMRASDGLSRDAVVTHHPLGVLAADEWSSQALRDFARALVVDLRFPLVPFDWSDDNAASETAEWFRQKHLAAVETKLAAMKMDVEELLRPAAPVDENCVSFCPRCGCQYLADIQACEPCGKRPVILYSSIAEFAVGSSTQDGDGNGAGRSAS